MARTSKRNYCGLAAAIATLIVGGMTANAAPPTDAERGQVLAEKLCAGCHLVGSSVPSATPVGPPPFAVLANKPAQTAERIRAVLIKPHVPMPDMQMSNDEMVQIIAYLQSLRDRTLPSLLIEPGQKDEQRLPARG